MQFFLSKQIAEARDTSLNIYDYHTIDCDPDFEATEGTVQKNFQSKFRFFWYRLFAQFISYGSLARPDFTIYSLLTQTELPTRFRQSEAKLPTIKCTDSNVDKTQPLVLIPSYLLA